MKGYYHSKETFGTVDGPGIRYVLFLAGCNLGCVFCHNPDTWQKGSKTITPQEVLADLQEYRHFYEDGGLTISGGEPLLQPEFVAETFALCKTQGIHTVLDTAGYCSAEALLQVLPYTDQVLFSLKAATRDLHRQLTAAPSNDVVLRNLRYIAARKPVVIRYVVLPGISDRPEELAALISLLQGIEAQDLQVDILAYHKMGVYKWEELGMSYALEDLRAAGASDVELVKEKLKQAGLVVAHA